MAKLGTILSVFGAIGSTKLGVRFVKIVARFWTMFSCSYCVLWGNRARFSRVLDTV